MSIQAMAWAFQQEVKPSIAKLILLAVANYCNDEGQCWPSKTRLARDCSTDKSTICKHLRTLSDLGFISLTERRDGEVQLSSLITLTMRPTPSGAEPTPSGRKPTTPGGREPTTPSGAEPTAPVGYSPPKPLIEPSIRTLGGASADEQHRQALELGRSIKGDKQAASARSFGRKQGTLDGSRGVRLSGGKLTVTDDAAAELAREFPGVDLANVCNRACPDLMRMGHPDRDDAMAVLRKWAQIVLESQIRPGRPTAQSEFRVDPSTPRNVKPLLEDEIAHA